MSKLEKKKLEKKQVLEKMIRLYCKNNHKDYLCNDCKNLISYSNIRTDYCKRLDEFFFCSSCDRTCYDNENLEKIRKIMRYSGPRMIYSDPKASVRFVSEKIKMKLGEKNR